MVVKHRLADFTYRWYFRKDGTPVPTPVWFALLGDRRLVVGTDRRTAKVRVFTRSEDMLHLEVTPAAA